jgi:hypothetical protein
MHGTIYAASGRPWQAASFSTIPPENLLDYAIAFP